MPIRRRRRQPERGRRRAGGEGSPKGGEGTEDAPFELDFSNHGEKALIFRTMVRRGRRSEEHRGRNKTRRRTGEGCDIWHFFKSALDVFII